MRGVNKVILVGTVGKDPETKSFPNGGSLSQFSIATSEAWTDKNSGERKENTEWHRIVFNGKQAELVQQYLRKGSKVYIEGSLRTRQWTDQNGQERYTTEIRGEFFQSLDSRPQGEQGNYNQDNQGGYNQGNQGGYNQGNQGGYNQGNQGGYNQGNQGGYNQGGYGGQGNKPAGNQGGYGGQGNKPAGNQGGYGGQGNKPAGNQGGYGGQGNKPTGNQGGYGGQNQQPPQDSPDKDDDLPF